VLLDPFLYHRPSLSRFFPFSLLTYHPFPTCMLTPSIPFLRPFRSFPDH
jgi:hypothetical protein